MDTSWYRKDPLEPISGGVFTTLPDGTVAFSLEGGTISRDGRTFTPSELGPSFTIDPPFPPNSNFSEQLMDGCPQEFTATHDDTGQVFVVRLEIRDGQPMFTSVVQTEQTPAFVTTDEDVVEYARFLGIEVRCKQQRSFETRRRQPLLSLASPGL